MDINSFFNKNYKIKLTVIFLFLGFGTTYGQKVIYKFSPSVTRFYTNGEVDSIFYATARSIFIDHQVPLQVFSERYSSIKKKLYKTCKKDINIRLANVKEHYGSLNKIPKNATEYIIAKNDIEKAIITVIKEKFNEENYLKLLLNFVAGDRIRSFHSDITILPNGKLSITETIVLFNVVSNETKKYDEGGNSYTVPVTNNDIKDRFERSLLSIKSHSNGLNFPYTVGIDKVLHNGEEEDFTSLYEEDYQKFLFGKEAKPLAFGEHTYIIKYHIDYLIEYGRDKDELNYNILGNHWQYAVDSVSCTLHLPNDGKAVAIDCSKSNGSSLLGACKSYENYSTGSINFTIAGGIKPNEGFVIKAVLPKGLVTQPGKAEIWSLTYLNSLGPLFIFTVALLLTLRALLVLRKKKKFVAIDGDDEPIQYEPPMNLDPVAIAIFFNRKFSHSITVAALVDLVVYKHLALLPKKQEGTEDHYYISAANEVYNGSLPTHHLFAKEGALMEDEALYNTNGNKAFAYFNSAVKEHAEHFGEKVGEKFLTYKNARKRWTKILYWFAAIISSIFILVHYQPNGYTFAYYFTGIILGYIVVYKIKLDYFKYTDKGIEILKQIAGFKRFLTTVDEYRYTIEDRPDARFLLEKYMPYAIALNCEKQWVEGYRNAILPYLEPVNEELPTYFEGLGENYPVADHLKLCLVRSDHVPFVNYIITKLAHLRQKYGADKPLPSEEEVQVLAKKSPLLFSTKKR